MLFFTVKGKLDEYPFVILDAKNFHFKLREVIFGKNDYIEYPTIYEDERDLVVEVLEIDIEPTKINQTVFEYYASIGKSHLFSPIYESTIKEKYNYSFLEQDFDFYQNLCDNYNVKEVAKVIYWSVYKNTPVKTITALTGISESQIMFMLEYLPVYINYLSKESEDIWPI